MHDKQQPISDRLFLNPKGKLCVTFCLFGKPRYTKIDVQPVFDGLDINGRIINMEDWSYVLS